MRFPRYIPWVAAAFIAVSSAMVHFGTLAQFHPAVRVLILMGTFSSAVILWVETKDSRP